MEIYQILNESFLVSTVGVFLNFTAIKQIFLTLYHHNRYNHATQIIQIIEKGNKITVNLNDDGNQNTSAVTTIAKVLWSYLVNVLIIFVVQAAFGCSLQVNVGEQVIFALCFAVILKESQTIISRLNSGDFE